MLSFIKEFEYAHRREHQQNILSLLFGIELSEAVENKTSGLQSGGDFEMLKYHGVSDGYEYAQYWSEVEDNLPSHRVDVDNEEGNAKYQVKHTGNDAGHTKCIVLPTEPANITDDERLFPTEPCHREGCQGKSNRHKWQQA